MLLQKSFMQWQRRAIDFIPQPLIPWVAMATPSESRAVAGERVALEIATVESLADGDGLRRPVDTGHEDVPTSSGRGSYVAMPPLGGATLELVHPLHFYAEV